MVKKLLNRKKLNPSEPVFTGTKHLDKTGIQQFRYNKNDYYEEAEYNVSEFDGFLTDGNQFWLNIHGIHDIEIVKKICNKLKVHNLAIQDILDVNQRPKFQEYEDHWFFSMKSVLPSNNESVEVEQLSFILGKNFLVSFQEKKADYFEHIRERIRKNVGVLRASATDYLLFLLLEAILDNYFKTINNIEDQLEKIEILDIDTDPSPDVLKTIELHRRHIHMIKKTVSPMKDFALKIERENSDFFNKKNMKYFFEIRDLCLSILDDCDKIELRLESSINMFFSVQGHRMNQVMKTLTVVATIFIPLTFIAGIYGMNFTNMPELSWKWGYFAVWGIMIGVLVGMIFYFKRKKWY